VSLFPREVARFIEERRISIWYSVPTILSALALRGGLDARTVRHLRTVLFAGEVFPTKHLRRLMELLPHTRLYNLFGPTETNVCTYYEVSAPPEPGAPPIPIGRAIDGVEVFAVTDEGRLAADGEAGELHVAGPTVMRGYWGDAARTAEVLVPDPRDTGAKVYRTGDIVRPSPDGDYLFLGRRDAQIKSRGYRIELGEIESALDAHDAVVECAVVAVPDDLVTNRLKAAVVVREPVEPGELASFCAQRIPRYMVPESFDFRSALPRTSTGKTDRQALLAELA
jgi:acyl-coenzyme A synthetase/AMP-(fatty) acid ligase